MSKLIPIWTAAMLALSCSAYVRATDDPRPTNEQKLQQQKDSAQEPAKQQTTGDLTKEEQEEVGPHACAAFCFIVWALE